MPASPTPAEPEAPARPGGTPDDVAAVRSVITGMYAAYMSGDRARIDSFLHPDATVFDSATPALLCGKGDLDRVRDARPDTGGEGPAEAGLTSYDHVVDVFGDLAVDRYWLRVDHHDAPPQLVRNTAVLHRRADGSGWLFVHLHEDVQDAG